MKKEITTSDICKARDTRMEKVSFYLEKETAGLILFLLNIPGSRKDLPLYRNVFNTGLRLIKQSFNTNSIEFSVKEINIPESGTGAEAYITVSNTELSLVKQITSKIEESHPLGRIFDIDVFNSSLNQIKSERKTRKCFICERPAFECARSRRHKLSEVVGHINKKAEKYFDSLCWKTASTAARAMISEVLVTPKPGLVDRLNTGAHSDMDIFTFTDSAAALVKTFYDIAKKGYEFNNPNSGEQDLSLLLEPLRKSGLEGEKTMFEITNGVNTHKGLIFSIGILAGAAGYLFSQSMEKISPELLCLTGKKIVKGITERDFKKTGDKTTSGERAFKKYGIKGARGEAEGGFKSSLKALSILKNHLNNKEDFNLSLAETLLYIISETEDTNIPGRTSIKMLGYAQDKCREFIKDGGVFKKDGVEKLKKLDNDFISRNISPGGSADILATTLFLYFMEENNF